MNTEPLSLTSKETPSHYHYERTVHDSEATAAHDEIERMAALQASQLRVPR